MARNFLTSCGTVSFSRSAMLIHCDYIRSDQIRLDQVRSGQIRSDRVSVSHLAPENHYLKFFVTKMFQVVNFGQNEFSRVHFGEQRTAGGS